MSIVVVGINHTKAGLGVRERFSLNPDALVGQYLELTCRPQLEEVFILSTCNRVEFYAVGSDAEQVAGELKDFLCASHALQPAFLERYFYCRRDAAAITHLYRVASGLDSMIIGEAQIIGQIKKAYERAVAAGAVGPQLHKTLQDALRVSKKVRHSTAISRGVTSISGVVVELIKQEPGIEQKKVLVIGAGKVGAMTVAKLADITLREITVINRDKAAAEALRRKPNVRVADIRMLPHEVFSADIVIAATAAPHLINREMIEALLSTRQAELLLVDLGVPRNIEETVRSLSGARLYNIDDLSSVIDQTIRARSYEAAKAEEIIAHEVATANSAAAANSVNACVCAR